jgi:hypothetical protein
MENNMTRLQMIAVFASALFFGFGATQADAQTRPAVASPATQPAASSPAASQPATQPADPNVVRILKELERVGEKYATLSADVRYLVEHTLIGDEDLRTGQIIIARGGGKGPDRLYVRFDTLKQGEGNTLKDKIEYALDGEWLVEAKDKIKTITRYQVAPPGQRVELFRIGKGPFPMPFGQKADDVLQYFEASTRPPVASDPNGTVYVKLVTRSQYREERDFLTAQMWLDATTFLPVKLVTENKNKDITTATFSKVQPNEKVDDKLFIIENKQGWNVIIRPYNER